APAVGPTVGPAPTPLYHQLAEALQQLIEQGTLRAGHRVPSVRRMALQRDVSVSTVIQAYTLLENRGLLEARPQSGYYVRPRLPFEAPEPRIARPMARPSEVGVSDLAADIMTFSVDPSYVPLGAACPDHTLFPTRKLARLIGAVGRNDPALLGRYAMNWAYDPLCREIARRYLQAGAPLGHEELVITLGCTEALNLSLRAVTKPGDTVAIETPAYFGLLQTLQALGLRVLEVPTDPRDGLCLDALRAALATCEVKAVVVMPAFQNPLGAAMPDDKKAALYDLLTEFDVPAIEDDIYGDLYFGERRPKPLKAWDRDGRVLLCSSFGKTLAPSLRVGWCAPGRYLERVRRLKFTNTLGTPVILQKTVSDFLRNGGYDHHLRSIRRAYRHQVQVFSQAIVRCFPAGTRISRPAGGFILWLELPVAIDTTRLHQEALDARISTAPGVLFSVKDRYRHCLRINCGLPWGERVESALETLGRLAARQLA
ncbi:MAG TPA: PLP-dependent aminotransferase family protein, partial [Candidatus Synoicihabitans sp.]|nr:PLP-dependent aminotransferase family protein [Candidatus Synoicihabitans sp.]